MPFNNFDSLQSPFRFFDHIWHLYIPLQYRIKDYTYYFYLGCTFDYYAIQIQFNNFTLSAMEPVDFGLGLINFETEVS